MFIAQSHNPKAPAALKEITNGRRTHYREVLKTSRPASSRPATASQEAPGAALVTGTLQADSDCVTAGCGWAQHWGRPVEEIRPGDAIWFAPGEKHWHGATPTTAMTHITIQEKLDNKVVDWMEQVGDEQYHV